MGLNFVLPWIFGVCPLTFPAFVKEPCVGNSQAKTLILYIPMDTVSSYKGNNQLAIIASKIDNYGNCILDYTNLNVI